MPLRLRTEMPEIKGITEWVNSEVSNEDLKGKPVLVHFWSISCHMCKVSLPDVNKIKEEYPELAVVGIHMPRSEKDLEIEPVKETIEKYELKHPQGIDNTHSVVDAFENEYVPAFYLFDPEGKLRHRSAGEKALSMLKTPLERVMNEIRQA
ncbi:redoxin domain-containing protein [Thermoflavimicrobium daqui]|jgi:thiol-disulfide isomerase/thioredoxin|uniref:Thiol-disulfide oxidoreductase n=1 Tax=Thermoflavimicrobium daqui TaxID=2137476 RepID=A0A364K1Q6_9BACL|nr:redoxin domain-containing protein [Thermoflavimicrobium daqui]RAL21863.1 thiol-disulfide oxidoreductase [Thermoflavimicrobium daqui]